MEKDKFEDIYEDNYFIGYAGDLGLDNVAISEIQRDMVADSSHILEPSLYTPPSLAIEPFDKDKLRQLLDHYKSKGDHFGKAISTRDIIQYAYYINSCYLIALIFKELIQKRDNVEVQIRKITSWFG
jgi:hypothetical protein